MGEVCADCGKPILMNEGSYYMRDPAGGCIGKTYHSSCGDPLGTKAKDAEIARLHAERQDLHNSIIELQHERQSLRAELAAKNARIAEEEKNTDRYARECDTLKARIAELEAWGDGLRESLGTTISTMEEERARAGAEAEAKAMRKALEPFAEHADGRDQWPDAQVFTLNVTMRTLRKASAALAPSSVDEKLK